MKYRNKSLNIAELKRVLVHDLTQPLHSICAYAGLLKKKAEDRLTDDELEFLDYIIICSKRHYSIISMLNGIYEKASPEIIREKVNTEKVILNILKDLQHRITKTFADIVVKDLPEIKGNEALIYLLFKNLIENSLKYCKNGQKPQLVISAVQQGDYTTFSFGDSGIGIKEEDISEIFNLFRRSESSNNAEGIGVGLAVCKEIVKLHEGEITVKSTYGEGTTVLVKLPMF